MSRYVALLLILLFISTAQAMGPNRTEFVSGDGLLWSSFGQSVDFVIDASQRDPQAPVGGLAASFFSFPAHLFMTLETTALDSVEVDRRRGEVNGQALVIDSRTGFDGIVEFSAVFEEAQGRKQNRPRNDAMILTVFLPSGAETFAGSILSGGIEVGTRRN